MTMNFKRARAAAEKRMMMMRRDVIIGVLVDAVEMGSVVVVALRLLSDLWSSPLPAQAVAGMREGT